jgi:LAO/AO transport system kinase
VGQDEVEIARASHTTVVVSAPGLGDEVQAIKAGDAGDRRHPRGVEMRPQRRQPHRHGHHVDAHDGCEGRRKASEWTTPVVGVSAIENQGLDELMTALAAHRKVAFETETGRQRQLDIARFRLHKTAENLLLEAFAPTSRALETELAPQLQQRKTDPYTLARKLLVSSLKKEFGDELASHRAA